MHNKIRAIMFILAFAIMLVLCGNIINHFTPTITEQRAEKRILKTELSISPEDYREMVKDLEQERDKYYEQINRQSDSIATIEDTMAFLLKEDILNKVSDAIKDTGASFDNFYVTFEGAIKNDYSIQVKGNIYQINQFIENMFIGTPGISIGEFSIRENETTSYLSRYFDESNALMWYDGTLYKVENSVDAEQNGIKADEIEQVKQEVFKKLPKANEIEYVMTLTFRV